MTVLVTGGSGFVGSYVVRDLIRAGERVVVYDASTSGNAIQSVLPERPGDDVLITVQGAITDGWLLQRLCQEHRVRSIVHLASPLTQDVTENPVRGIEDICLGTATVFEVARTCQIRRVVWASSVAVFGPASAYPPGPIANDAAHRPTSLYGSCKSLCETMAERYRTVDHVDNVCLRLTVVYGSGRLRGYMSFPSHIVRDAALDRDVTIPYGDQVMNWQYVEDVSSLILTILAADHAPSQVAFNTSGDVRSFRDAASLLRSLAPGISIDVGSGGDPALADTPMDFDDSLLREDFGFTPRFSLERGLHATFEEYTRILSSDGSRFQMSVEA